MSVEQNKESLRRCFEEVWNRGDLSVIPEVISPDYVGYSPGATVKGLDGFEQMVRSQRTAMPDIHWSIDEVYGEGDTLAVRLTTTGTFTGKMGDTEPTGKRVNIQLVLINRYVDGKCVEATSFADRLTQYQQLGIPIPQG